MDPEIVHLSPLRVVMLRHLGSYDGISAVFDRLDVAHVHNQEEVRAVTG